MSLASDAAGRVLKSASALPRSSPKADSPLTNYRNSQSDYYHCQSAPKQLTRMDWLTITGLRFL